MMGYYLRSCSISGFKSFARPTVLEFASGVTALVGPNGSGKSNVVDAIRWCLGEQNVRDLRGQRAEDVIHAGASRVLGMAEVSLTFEPVDGEEQSGDQLTITRRLFQSGESEYRVNGRKSRLRDLTTALKGLDIDAGRNLTVNQGMADAWLTANPVERRALIEQAAGLTLYRERRDDARQKLVQVRRNCELVESVVAEIEPRLRLLKRQARAVEERDAASARLGEYLRAWHWHRWNDARCARDLSEQGARESAALRRDLEERLRGAEEQADEARRAEERWNAGVSEAVQKLHMSERARDSAEADEARLRARKQHLEEMAASLSSELMRIEQARAAAESRSNATRAQLTELTVEVQQLVTAVDARDARLRESERAVAEFEMSERRIGDEVREALLLADSLKASHRALEESLAAQDVELKTAAEWLAENMPRHIEDRLAADALAKQVRTLSAELEAAVTAEARTRQTVRAAQARLDRVERLVTRLAARAAHLERQSAASERQADALTAADDLSLVQRLTVSDGWETAISSALAEWASASADSDHTHRLHPMGDGALLSWRRTVAVPDGCAARWASEVCGGIPDGYIDPLGLTLVVEDDGEAEALWRSVRGGPLIGVNAPPVQIVSRAGTCWSAVGVRRAGVPEPAIRLLRVRREALNLRGRLERTRARLVRLEQERRRATDSVDTERRCLTDVEARVSTLTRERRKWEEELEGVGRRLRDHQAMREDYTARAESAQARRDRDAGERDKIRTRMEAADALLVECRAELARVAAGRLAARGTHEALSREFVATSARIDAMSGQIEVLNGVQDDTGRVMSALDQELDDVMSRRGAAQAQLEAIAEQLGARASDTAMAEQAVREAEDALAVARAARPYSPASGGDIVTVRRDHGAAVGRHEQGLSQLRQRDQELQAAIAEALHDLGVRPEALPEPVGPRPSEDEIRRLRVRATQYADVDAAVVQEHQDLDARRQDLLINLDDIHRSSDDLRQIIAVTDREMNERFARAFDAVTEEFGRVFRLMVRGGEAGLRLDPDSGGIDVIAQLPGKRTRSSAAFSGGERALIASALLFGVLRIRPTPFCILDEVDAALDESNVDRYLTVLRDISVRTQVIVVTHNRATMAAADVLYGMTMDKEGASEVLSLRLDAFDEAG